MSAAPTKTRIYLQRRQVIVDRYILQLALGQTEESIAKLLNDGYATTYLPEPLGAEPDRVRLLIGLKGPSGLVDTTKPPLAIITATEHYNSGAQWSRQEGEASDVLGTFLTNVVPDNG